MAALWRWCFLHWAHCCLFGPGSPVELLCQRVPWCPWHGPLFSCHPATDPPSLTAESIPVAFHLLHFHFLPSEPPTAPPPLFAEGRGGPLLGPGSPVLPSDLHTEQGAGPIPRSYEYHVTSFLPIPHTLCDVHPPLPPHLLPLFSLSRSV